MTTPVSGFRIVPRPDGEGHHTIEFAVFHNGEQIASRALHDHLGELSRLSERCGVYLQSEMAFIKDGRFGVSALKADGEFVTDASQAKTLEDVIGLRLRQRGRFIPEFGHLQDADTPRAKLAKLLTLQGNQLTFCQQAPAELVFQDLSRGFTAEELSLCHGLNKRDMEHLIQALYWLRQDQILDDMLIRGQPALLKELKPFISQIKACCTTHAEGLTAETRQRIVQRQREEARARRTIFELHNNVLDAVTRLAVAQGLLPADVLRQWRIDSDQAVDLLDRMTAAVEAGTAAEPDGDDPSP